MDGLRMQTDRIPSHKTRRAGQTPALARRKLLSGPLRPALLPAPGIDVAFAIDGQMVKRTVKAIAADRIGRRRHRLAARVLS